MVLQDMIDKLIENWKMLWNGNEYGKHKSNENFKITISSKTYNRPRTTEECGFF
jgi:hypothetical protein